MTEVVLFKDTEIAEPADFEAVSRIAQHTADVIVGGAIGYPRHWARFTIAASGPVGLLVSRGHLFSNEVIYDLAAPFTVDLTAHLPRISGDERYVAILVRGRVRTEEAIRFVEIDADTGDNVPESAPKFEKREVFFTIVEAPTSPTPIRPDIPAGECCLGFVRLGTTGILQVESSQDFRVKTLFEIEGRVIALEAQMIVAFARTTTLETDLANLQARFNDLPRREAVFQLQRDMARVRRLLDLPDEARGYFYDPGLVKDQWDISHPDWGGRVDEGLRFSFFAERDTRLAVLNPAQPGIRLQDDALSLAWTEENVITVEGTGSTKNISQQVHTERVAVQRSIARSAVSYGPTIAMCDNVQEWAQIGKVREGQQFQANGETFQKIGTIDARYAGANIDTTIFNRYHENAIYDTNQIILHNAHRGQSGNREIYAARSVQVSYWTEYYWDYVTTTYGVNGSVYAQTFLLTQPTIATSIELNFDRVAADGAVTLLLVEVDPTGVPLFDQVIARSTIEAANLRKGWNRFGLPMRYLAPGRRYAWVTITTGNHSIRTVTGAKYAEGTLFWSTDTAWFQGAPEEDFHFKINGALFSTTRAEIEFDLLTLDGGMTEIRLLYESWSPEGTSMAWSVKPSGRDEFVPLQPETDQNPNPLRGLPAGTQLRLVMQGTTRLSPALMLTATARATTRRPRSDAKWITKNLVFGYTASSIRVELTVDQFDPARHTVVPRIRSGSTLFTATSVTRSQDLAKGTRQKIVAIFTGVSLSQARLQIDATTNNVQFVPFVQDVSLFAL